MKGLFNSPFRKAIELKSKREKQQRKPLSKPEKDKRTKQWTTFYRRNMEIYAEERLRIKLRPFQRIMIHLMGVSQVFFAICARASAKTFTVALFAVMKCMLYPYTEVVITASTLDQGALMVRTKIQNELIGKLSPILKYLYDEGLITINKGKDDVKVEFTWNGSFIQVLPPVDSSRGNRATVIVYEECRLLKYGDVSSIFEPMHHPRQAMYLQKEEYLNDPDLIEEGISIYITSARFKAEWFWRVFKQTVVNCYLDTKVPYNFFAADIYTALKYKLKTQGDWSKIQKTTNELDLRMEYLNEMVGEVEDAYFTFDLFRRNQRLRKAFRPPTNQEFNEEVDMKNTKKKASETRILTIDFAFANTVKGSLAADNTVIGCMSGFYNKEDIIVNLDYMETLSGGESEQAVQRIHELFWDYQADYIVFDIRSGGEVMYNNLTKAFEHPERPRIRWDKRGFSVSNETGVHVVSDSKLNDLRGRAVDTDAIPCMIPVEGSPKFNSLMWQSLHKSMRDGTIRFLIDDSEFRQTIEDKKSFVTATPNERMRILLPYVQTSMLVSEGINLRPEWREGVLKLRNFGTNKKDRMVALSYGNYFFRLLENKMLKQDQEDEFSEEAWSQMVIV